VLKEFEFDHRNIEEEALVEQYYTDPSGTERLSRVVDRSKLNKLIRQRNAEGRRIMEPFRLWCITYEGLSADNADRKAAMAYVAIWETYNRPWEKLLREDINDFKKNELRRSLSLFGKWLSLEGPTVEDKEWGRRILTNTSRLKAPKGRTVREKPKERHKLSPLSKDEWAAIFDAIEHWHKRRGASRPWARPFFRLRFKLGLHHTKTGLYYLERQAIEEALQDAKAGQKGVTIKLWDTTTRARLVPIRLVKKDLEALCSFPAPWGILADLISPFLEDEDARVRSSTTTVGRVWKEVVQASGGKVQNTREWHRQAKLAAMREAWETTQDKILLQSMFGVSMATLNNFTWLS